jgi:hypothetical protein
VVEVALREKNSSLQKVEGLIRDVWASQECNNNRKYRNSRIRNGEQVVLVRRIGQGKVRAPSLKEDLGKEKVSKKMIREIWVHLMLIEVLLDSLQPKALSKILLIDILILTSN